MTVIGTETITSWDIQVIRYFAILTGENIADYRDHRREFHISKANCRCEPIIDIETREITL